jgi:hypothetical protein
VNNYHYIDECGILHDKLVQFIDPKGQVHEKPLQFVAEYGTVYDDLDYDSHTTAAHTKHKCYGSMTPRRRHPYVKRRMVLLTTTTDNSTHPQTLHPATIYYVSTVVHQDTLHLTVRMPNRITSGKTNNHL